MNEIDITERIVAMYNAQSEAHDRQVVELGGEGLMPRQIGAVSWAALRAQLHRIESQLCLSRVEWARLEKAAKALADAVATQHREETLPKATA